MNSERLHGVGQGRGVRTEHLGGMAAFSVLQPCALVEQKMCYSACTASSDLLVTQEAFAFINTGAIPLGGEGIRGKGKSGFIKTRITAGPEKKSLLPLSSNCKLHASKRACLLALRLDGFHHDSSPVSDLWLRAQKNRFMRSFCSPPCLQEGVDWVP